MYNIIAGDCRDVIALIPTTNVSSTKIHELFTNVLESITPLGYNVVGCLLEEHASNVKFFSKELC